MCAIYEGSVFARLRREHGTSLFTPLKNGGGDIVARIGDDAIRVRAERGPGAWLARLLGVDITLDPKNVEARIEKIPVLGGLSEQPYVVLEDRARKREVALRPRDGDLFALEKALDRAGASVRRR